MQPDSNNDDDDKQERPRQYIWKGIYKVEVRLLNKMND